VTTRDVIRVADVMERDYVLLDGVATVAEALAVLRERGATFLLVAKRHEDDEVGIVMVADIAKHVLARNRSPERTNVYESMSKPVLAVEPRMDIRYCARLFHRFGISTAPVIEAGEVRGVVTYDQLVLKGLAADSRAR
jgi:predicted transcriptional regulator